MIKKVTEEKFWEIYEHDSTQLIEEESYKHDMVLKTFVTEWEGKFWMYTIVASYNDGFQFWDDIQLVEVEKYEKTVVDWRPVE